jgi:hypothetical protein
MTFRPRRGRGGTETGASRAPALALASVLLFTSTSTNALGATPPSRVVLVRERGADPVIDRAEVRLAAELRSAGFDVEEKVAESDDEARQLVEEPGEEGPFATVLLRRAGARAATEVWVADHVTKKTVVRRFGTQGGDNSDRTLALRVVELMRASLVEPLVLPSSADAEPVPAPSAAPAPSTTVPAPPPDVLRWTRAALRGEPPPPSPRVGFAFGLVGGYAGPDVAPSVGPQLRVVWHATRAWSVGLLGATTVFGGDAPVRNQGTAHLRQDLGLVELGFELPTDAPVHFLASAGVGAYHLYGSGDANSSAGFKSLNDDIWTALVALGGGIRWRLTSAASLVVDVREVLALPRPVVDFASPVPGAPAERVAETMFPGTLVGLSLAADL